MKTIKQVWQAIYKRAPEPRKQLAQSLLTFLKRLDNPHARLLTGRSSNEAGDEPSAQRLEAWVVGEFREGRISKLDAAEWLRLIFDAIVEFNSSNSTLFPTRLADVVRPESSPFSPAAMTARRRVDQWRDALHGWIAISSEATSLEDWQAAVALSSVLHGALLDTTKLDHLMEKLSRKEPPIIESGISKVIFDLPFQGLGNHHLQRWFIDPMTEMLVWRLLKSGGKPSHDPLAKMITKFLMARGVKKVDCPSGLMDLMATMKTWWSERAAPIDLHCATRNITSHAIHERSWARLQGQAYDPRAFRKARMQDIEEVLDEDLPFEDLLLLNPWLAQAIEALEIDDPVKIKTEVTALLEQQEPNDLPSIFLGWLSAMLNGFSAAKEPLALSTIRRRFGAAAPRLLALLGENNPVDMATDLLEDYYAELTTDLDPVAPVRDIASGLRDFHAFLHKEYGKPLMRKEAEVLGDENSLKPVDANLVSFDDYLKAQDWLDQQRFDAQEKQICKIVLMLAFRVGMRRMEIFGLQVCDIHVIGGLVCLVRPNTKRRLKTQSSRRVLPLNAFLSRAERDLLKGCLEARKSALNPFINHSQIVGYLFPRFGEEKYEAWVDRISDRVCNALRAVTGDKSLFLHHLRHSFGTWTYLRLRAPDFPEIARHFSHLPATVFAIHTGARLRVLLLGRNPAITRSYAFAVCRLLGHSSPVVSMGHYIHSADLLMGESTRRECSLLAKPVQMSASGLQKSAAYEHLADSLNSLLLASRQNFFPEKAQQVQTPQKKKRGRKPKLPAHMQAGWTPLADVQKILTMSIDDKKSAADIAKAIAIAEERIDFILIEAGRIGPLIGLKSDEHGQLTECPGAVRETKAIAFCEELERKLAELAARAPILYKEGIDLYLDHFDLDKHDTVFKAEKDLKDASHFLRFMQSLGADHNEFSWVIRTLDLDVRKLPKWSEQLKTDWQPAGIKTIRPKAARWAASYAQWLGILPIDETGWSLGASMAKTILLVKIGNSLLR